MNEQSLRAEVRAWLADNYSPKRPRKEWLELVIDKGYAVPTWPTEWYGLGLPNELGRAIADEFRAAKAPGAGQDIHNLWANTLLAYGTDALKQKLIRRLLLED